MLKLIVIKFGLEKWLERFLGRKVGLTIGEESSLRNFKIAWESYGILDQKLRRGTAEIWFYLKKNLRGKLSWNFEMTMDGVGREAWIDLWGNLIKNSVCILGLNLFHEIIKGWSMKVIWASRFFDLMNFWLKFCENILKLFLNV